MHLLNISSSCLGKSESQVCWCPRPSHRLQAQGQLACFSFFSAQTSWLSGKEAAISWALHNLPASEKRGFPPTYFLQRIRDNEVLPLEWHLDFCVIFQGGLSSCSLKHKYGDKTQDKSLVWHIGHFRINQTYIYMSLLDKVPDEISEKSQIKAMHVE